MVGPAVDDSDDVVDLRSGPATHPAAEAVEGKDLRSDAPPVALSRCQADTPRRRSPRGSTGRSGRGSDEGPLQPAQQLDRGRRRFGALDGIASATTASMLSRLLVLSIRHPRGGIAGDRLKPVPITGTDATYEAIDKAMILTAAMTGLRIGELQALDRLHPRARTRAADVRPQGAKAFTKPKSRRSERAVPMPDGVASYLLRLLSTYHPDTVEPDPDALVFAHPVTGDPLGHRLMYERAYAQH